MRYYTCYRYINFRYIPFEYILFVFDSKAIVPDGICVTAIALRNHINENEDLSNGLNDAIKIAKENNFGKLSDYCERYPYNLFTG